jgi:hypothetical protein
LSTMLQSRLTKELLTSDSVIISGSEVLYVQMEKYI